MMLTPSELRAIADVVDALNANAPANIKFEAQVILVTDGTETEVGSIQKTAGVWEFTTT